MLAVEELERVRDAELVELGGEGPGAEVEVVLVALAGVDVDAPHRTQGVGVARRHHDRVVLEPELPDVVDQPAAGEIEREQGFAGPVGIG